MEYLGMTLVLILLLGIVLLLAAVFRKVKLIHLQSFEILEHTRVARVESENVFSQIQCLGLLERLLGMPQSLPPMRGWAGSPDFLLHLARYAIAKRPRVVVECSSGVSTIVLARCMQMIGEGHVYSLEHESIYSQKTQELLREHGLEQWATVIYAPLVARKNYTPWYDDQVWVDQMRAIELLVVDGPPQAISRLARYPALPLLIDRMADKFAVFVDDASRPDETEMVTRWLREVPSTSASSLSAEKGLTIIVR